MPACCSPTKTAATTTRSPAACPICSIIYSVRRLVAAGADCIKILLYYTPFDPPEINEIKHAWVERIGAECAAVDVPFFLEFVGYEEGGDEKGIGFARKKPDIVTAKHGGILQAAIRRGRAESGSPGEHGLRRRAARPARANPPTRAMRPRSISAAPPPRRKKPFIYLSAGVSNESSSKPSNSRPKPAQISPAFCAAAPPGKTACPSTPSKA